MHEQAVNERKLRQRIDEKRGHHSALTNFAYEKEIEGY